MLIMSRGTTRAQETTPMAIYGAAYELTLNRLAAGAEIHPNQCRLYRSNSVWAGSPLRSTLDRGYVPYPATGDTPNTRRIDGLSNRLAGGPARISGAARDNFAFVDGTLAALTAGQNLIQRCGYTNFIGRGRGAPGDYVYADDDVQTAIVGGSTATTLYVDVYAGPGDTDSLAGTGEPWETSSLNGGMWGSHLGIYDFVDSDVDENSRQDALFLDMVARGNQFVLPNGVVLQDCTYASISPQATIWLAPGDYGTTIPTDVAANTAAAFRNHPGVFLRSSGSDYLRAVTRRWRDHYSLTATQTAQPLGIYTYGSTVSSSKWLIVVDGVPSVVQLSHGDFRRPRDIWNNVIVPLIHSTGSNSQRIPTFNFYGDAIGTETRWRYLEYASFLGEPGNVQQDNTAIPG